MTNRHKYFFDRLREMGLFVRDYDAVFVKDFPKAVSDLHLQICHLSEKEMVKEWLELPLGALLEAFAKDTGLNFFERIEGLSYRENDPNGSDEQIKNEHWLQEQIEQAWGKHGAHAELFRDLLRKLKEEA